MTKHTSAQEYDSPQSLEDFDRLNTEYLNYE